MDEKQTKPRRPLWFWLFVGLGVIILFLGLGAPSALSSANEEEVTYDVFLQALEAGKRVVIFPDWDKPYNDIIYEFQDRFIALGRMYQRQFGKLLAFVPMYAAPSIRKVAIGKPVYYDDAARPSEERTRVCQALMDAVTALGKSLPRHRVTPFPNLPRKEWRWSRPEGEEPR